MRFIAHRGNINGPNTDLENNPRYIIQAIEKGFDVEIDVWKTDALYLGHDGPDHKIELKFLLNHKDHLWCHAKNIKSLEFLIDQGLNTFWHQTDDFTITSDGHIWAYPGKMANGILVMPENIFDTEFLIKNEDNIKGICSDFIKQYKDFLV